MRLARRDRFSAARLRLWKQDYFAALAGLDQFKSLGKVFEGKGMGQDRSDVEAGFEETG